MKSYFEKKMTQSFEGLKTKTEFSLFFYILMYENDILLEIAYVTRGLFVSDDLGSENVITGLNALALCCIMTSWIFNSLAPGRCEWNFKLIIYKLILVIDGKGITWSGYQMNVTISYWW